MSLSFKRVLSTLISLALVVGILPPGCIQAMAANRGEIPSGRLGLPALSSLRNSAGEALRLGSEGLSLQPGAAAGVAAAPQKVPLEISVPAAATENMTPAQKEDLAALVGIMQSRLFTWNELAINLPHTIFDKAGKPIIDASALFQEPQANELERLAIKHGKLSAEQFQQLRDDATFSVASDDFPGQTHVWKVSGFLQKGTGPSRDSLHADYAMAASHYLNSLPDTINGEGALSLRKSLSNLGKGLYETLGLAIGISETSPTHNEGSIERARLEALSEYMNIALPGRDMALYDVKLMEKAWPLIEAAQEKADAGWSAKAEALTEELTRTIKDPQALADALATARQNELFVALRDSAEIEALHPGLPAMLLKRAEFKQAMKAALNDDAVRVRAHGAAVAKELKAAHPILSMVPNWVEKRAAAAMKAYADGLIPALQGRIAAAAKALGLDAELAAETSFQKDWGRTRAQMLAMTEASRSFDWDYSIWSRKNWIVERSGEDGSYYGSRTRTVTSTTMEFFWRLSNLAQRYLTASNNLLYWTLSSNLIDGSLGLKSLFGKAPFAYRWELDEKTGQWEERGERRGTLRSRISGFYAQRRSLLEEHEKKGKYAFFIGKGGERLILFFLADIGLGLISPLLVALGQPLLTAVNVSFSAAMILAAPLALAPAFAAGAWAFQALVFDSAGTLYDRWKATLKRSLGLIGTALLLGAAWYVSRWFGVDLLSGYWMAGIVAVMAASGPLFPWVGTLLKEAGLHGAVAGALSVVKAVAHVIAGPLIAVLGKALHLFRRFWDNLMTPLLRWRASVPSESGRFIKRIAGPGLTSEYFFQVSGDLPLVAAWASLESSELTRYQGDMKSLIAKPQEAYAQLAAVIDALTQGNNRGSNDSPAYALIAQKERANEEALSEAITPRAQLYSKLLEVSARGKIKLPAKELETLLKKTAVLSENFYAKVMKDQGWSADKIAAFWKGHALSANDWVGLGQRTLSGIFGAEILTPMEETDKKLKIQVTAPGLEDYAKGLSDGIMPGQLDNVSVDLGQQPSQAGVESKVPVVTGREIIGGML